MTTTHTLTDAECGLLAELIEARRVALLASGANPQQLEMILSLKWQFANNPRRTTGFDPYRPPSRLPSLLIRPVATQAQHAEQKAV